MMAAIGRDAFVAQTSSALATMGFPRMAAAVLMVLTASDSGSMTAKQLSEELNASPAAISGAVRYLTGLSIIRRHAIPGDRRYTYELPNLPWYTASVEKNLFYERLIELSDEAVAGLPPDSLSAARIAEMGDFFRFISSRLPGLLAEWHDTRR